MGAVRPEARLALAAIVIVLVALIVYRDALFVPNPAARYPWSSDAWGHLIKAEYLREQISSGHWYPDLFPHWYSGQQMLRYYAPLPYYILAGLLVVTGDIFTAGNWFLFLAALTGGLSMLLYTPRFGLLPAMLGGLLLVLLPDNLRVAFAEGNLPRVLAAALLPATFFCVLHLLGSQYRCRFYFALSALLLSAIILTHAMMAAIFSACLGLFAVVYWLAARARVSSAALALLSILAGILLAGWWLLPSLTGGITDLNTQASSEALARFPWNVVFNLGLRLSNRETYYLGVSFLLVLGLALAYWRRLDALARSLAIVGLVTLAVSSTLFNDLHTALPLHHLFWPLRFMSFAGFILVLAAVALASALWRLSGPRLLGIGRLAVLGMIAVMVADFWQSTPLVFTRQAPPDLVEVAESLDDLPGWRVAAIDLSQLGSAPSYLFTAVGHKEQVYGWAYQGAATAPMLSRLNQAIETGYAAYAVDRLERLGADIIVLLKSEPDGSFAYVISPEIAEALPAAGYQLRHDSQRLRLYHKAGGPRAHRLDTNIFGIGTGAQDLALLFPEILVGADTRIDAYDVSFLSQFETILLSGFDWKDKGDAERMITELAGQGRRVVIDLTGVPVAPLARIPEFLGVYGERVALPDRPAIVVNGIPTRLRPFSPDYSPWNAIVPQGVDSREVAFPFGGIEATVIGSKRVGSGVVKFIGLNLTFHAVLTQDPVAIEILESELGVQAHRRPTAQPLPLEGYTAGQDGYTFSLDVTLPGLYVVPVAYHDGTAVYVDGRQASSLSIDSLTAVQLQEGAHSIEVRPLRTPVYAAGKAATVIGILIVLSAALAGVRFPLAAFTFVEREARKVLPPPEKYRSLTVMPFRLSHLPWRYY